MGGYEMIDLLAENPLLLLFTVIGLGYLIGNIAIFGFRLGVAAVLFVGIAFGALDYRLGLPEYIYIIGLVLFVYAIGLHSGPGFFASFQKRGFRFSAVAVLVLASAAIVALIIGRVTNLPAPAVAGLFCGALTNTPALAAAVETAKNLSANLSPEMQNLYVTSPVVTYGLTYPFGVFGVILALFLAGKFIKPTKETSPSADAGETAAPAILSRTYKITNPAVVGKTVDEVLQLFEGVGFVLSRIRKGEKTDVVAPETVLASGDLIVAVGDAEGIERARLLFGEQASAHIPAGLDGINFKRLYVSNKTIVGKSIRDLQLHKRRTIITRMRRGDVEFVPSLDTVVEMGDRVRIVTPQENLELMRKYFGDSVKSVSETDYLSLSLGVVLGVFLGMIPIPLPHGLTFKLGFAGGPLIAGLILGRLEKTGPIIWEMPYNANLVLRQVGLVFFLAAIGTKAGSGLTDTIRTGGWSLVLAGAVITLVVSCATICVGMRYLRLPMPAVMGMISGIQTQPAVLAYANQQCDCELPNVWYATVYPASMVAKIILAQLIVSTILMF